MNDGAILDLAKQSGLVSQTYTIEGGNVSWPRLKAFAELVRAYGEGNTATPEEDEVMPIPFAGMVSLKPLPEVKSLEELAREEGDKRTICSAGD